MNILWHSHRSSVPSGYGALTRALTPRLKQAGHQVAISACDGTETSAVRNRSGIWELPCIAGPDGDDTVQAHMRTTHAQLALSVLDPTPLAANAWGSLPWAAWLPPSGEQITETKLQALQAARWVIAMSRRDEQQLRGAGLQPLYVPPGIDLNTYKPVDRRSAREEMARFVDLGIAGWFVVMSPLDGAATSAGYLADLLRSFGQFAQTHRNALLYLHPESGEDWDDESILALARRYGVADRVALPPHYAFAYGLVNATTVNQLYNAADVFLQLSQQSNGLMALAAQCAGCPVVTLEATAEAELCEIGWRTAYLEKVPEALAAAYQLHTDSHQHALRRMAHEKAVAYDADRVMVLGLGPMLARIGRELATHEARTVFRNHLEGVVYATDT